MNNNRATIKKLQTAIKKRFGVKVLINTTQWYSTKKDCNMTLYTLKQLQYNEDRGQEVPQEVFKTYSMLQLILYLRDLWYKLNGWPVPTDNEIWNEIKRKEGIDDRGTTEI